MASLLGLAYLGYSGRLLSLKHAYLLHSCLDITGIFRNWEGVSRAGYTQIEGLRARRNGMLSANVWENYLELLVESRSHKVTHSVPLFIAVKYCQTRSWTLTIRLFIMGIWR